MRIEDIDRARSRPEWEAAIYDDLAWLGLDWPRPVRRQSDHLSDYRRALDRLWSRGLLFRCDCRRRDIQAAISAPQEGAAIGPDGLIYPGTCRDRHPRTGPLPDGVVLRLDMRRAVTAVGLPARFVETGVGDGTGHVPQTVVTADELVHGAGDIVLARRDMGTSYHLSVVVDDAAQSITEVVRGADLFEAVKVHVLLQALLGLPQPTWHHHRLIRDADGRRLAKRDDARALSLYRADGLTPADVRAMVGLKENQDVTR